MRKRYLSAAGSVALCTLALAAGLQQAEKREVDLTTRPANPRTDNWKLVWSDEFDGNGVNGKPDPAKWSYEHGFIRNNEKQFYTDRQENVRVEDGKLVIEARKESHPVQGKEDATFTSGSIETLKRNSAVGGAGETSSGSWKYARVEARAKFTQARGTWPAIWMLGNWGTPFTWPDHGEIDIMENVGYMPDQLFGTVHTKAFNHVRKTEVGKSTKLDNLSADYHTYAIEWTEEKINFFIDDKLYFTFNNQHKTEAEWPFDHPQWLKLNFAVGGAWGGQKGIDEAAFPQKMMVDWVRVYQRK